MKTLKVLNSKHLKIIAYITMLIDHIGAIVVINIINKNYGSANMDYLFNIYNILRTIGRISFPIFTFSIVEGFQKTSNIHKYIFRLFIFALISEVPFDLALYKIPFYWGYQNVIWTFLIGICLLYLITKVKNIFLSAIFTIFAMIFAEFIHSDYGAYGILLIYAFYSLRNFDLKYFPWALIMYSHNPYSLPALIFIYLYNEEKGMEKSRWLYYFYPLHLFILYIITLFI